MSITVRFVAWQWSRKPMPLLGVFEDTLCVLRAGSR